MLIDREAIFAGQIVQRRAAEATRLTGAVRALLAEELPTPRQAQWQKSPEAFWAHIGAVRARLTSSSLIESLVCELILAMAGPGPCAIDVLRLRAVRSGGHRELGAEPAYVAHRDTWYANPQAQLNWWLPLYAAPADETFELFPDLFSEPLENSSGSFDYTEFVERVGWQRLPGQPGAAAVYPTLSGTPQLGTPRGVSCDPDEVLIFSAAQLHRPVRHDRGHTRFSVDFRSVHHADVEGRRGAPNVDNQSSGSALADYRWGTRWAPR